MQAKAVEMSSALAKGDVTTAMELGKDIAALNAKIMAK
jgi:cytochrome b involved in lipid metabolism